VLRVATVVSLLTGMVVPGILKERDSSSGNKDCSKLKVHFVDALVLANKPGGIVVEPDLCIQYPIEAENITSELPLKETLNLITKANPAYSWIEKDCVITLLLLSVRPELLRTEIGSARILLDANLDTVISQLVGLPDVTAKLKELDLKAGLQFGGLHSPPKSKLPTEMSINNMTLYDVLNEIVRKRGRGVWVYSESEFNGDKRFALEFVVK